MNNPCIDCLTYAMCKQRLIKEFLHQMTLTQQFPLHLSPYELITFKAAEISLVKKCTLLHTYILRSKPGYDRALLRAINEAYNVTDEKGDYNQSFIDGKPKHASLW